MGAPGTSVLGRRYVLGERIGAGGFSEVWRATDLVLARPVAIKLLHLGNAEALTRFRAEAQHAGGLSHENIARIYDYVEPAPPQPPFLVMELVDGPSLAGALAAGPLDPARCLDVVAQTASGLHEAHLSGLVHRDIKPANLLLAPGGLVKITDFGIAQAADSAPVTVTGQLLGTPGYLAPERVLGAPATSASDLYSLGIVAYACLTGGPPFTGPALAVALAHRERPLPPLPGHVPGEVAALVLELTAKDPAGRPRSAGEVARRASLMAAGLVAEVAAAPPGQGPARDAEVPPVPPAELLTQHLHSRPSPVPRHRARRALRLTVLPAAAAIVVIAAAFLIGSTIDPGLAPHAGTVPSVAPSGPFRPGATQAATVEVRPGPLIGLPVTAAVHRLRQQGLSVRVVWRRSGAQPPGTVLSVQPAGQRPVGSLVILTAARTPRRHGQRGDGDRQGDGNQQGGGDQQGGTSNGKGQGHRNNDPAGSTVD
jgi:hypothetical protein